MYRDPSMTDFMHNEQTLWYTRRIVELERETAELRDRVQAADRRALNEERLADALAEQLRAVARGEFPERFVARDDPVEASRNNDHSLPLEQWRDARPFKVPRVRESTIREPVTEVDWP